MAFITFSALVSGVKGKLNGSYFQSSKGATSLKTISPKRSKAKATQTSWQESQQRLALIARNWKYLSSTQVENWASLAATLTRINKNGNPYTPSAYQMFNECNNNAFLLGFGAINSPGTPSEPIDILPYTVEFNLDSQLVVTHTGGIPEGKTLIVYASAPCSQGVSYPQSGYRVIKTISDVVLAETNIQSNYTSKWGQFATGQRMFFKLAVVDNSSFIQEGAKLTKADAG